jgi:lysophospholipase L1-like esterase
MACIVCLGDSITFGEYDREGGGWADRLKLTCFQNYLDGEGDDIAVFNCGIGGETSVGLKARFEVELSARLAPDEPCVVLLAYGMNDLAKRPERDAIPLVDCQDNLARVVAWCHAFGARVALLNITPLAARLDGLPNAHGSVRSLASIAQYNAGLAQLAEHQGIALIDVHSALARDPHRYLSADGVHPNAAGHAAMHDVVLAALPALLA